MTVAILLVTHENIGRNLVRVAESLLGETAENIACIEVPLDAPVAQVTVDAEQALEGLDTAAGAILITDSYGSTPSNIASTLLASNMKLISGLNLPMLLRIFNYRQLPLEELCEKAASGAQLSIAVHD